MRILRQVIFIPLWLLEVVSWAKSFRANPILGNWVLNALGLHVARVVISHVLFGLRLRLLAPLANPQDRRAFAAQGFLIKHDFLPEADFTAIKEEIQHYHGPMREEAEGNTLTQRVFLTHRILSRLPRCASLTKNPRLLRLMRYCSSKNRIPFFHLENLRQHAPATGPRDSQKDLHSDTFHPCVKAWLYLDAADASNGPFEYVPGSHRLTWRRLRWEYRQSLQASRQGTQPDSARYWDGSFRVTEAEPAEMGMGQPVAMTVPPNTLLIANVHGFHRRGEASASHPRLSVWMQSRDNPFNPLFTPLPGPTAQIFEWAWSRHMAVETRRKVTAGQWKERTGHFSRERDVP
jgi:hypothetical protein